MALKRDCARGNSVSGKHPVNWKFVFRGGGFALLLLVFILIASGFLLRNLLAAPASGPLPPPPIITAPRGQLPSVPVGLKEWARYQGEEYQPAGSGFFFLLDNRTVVVATTAHSVALSRSDHPLERIALGVADEAGFIAEMNTLFGEPGKPRLGRGLTGDFILLRVDHPIDPALVLLPDPRGEPQAGERVALYNGLGDGSGGLSVRMGTVQVMNRYGAWVVMDEIFHPGGMSGSPFLSEHTGKVLGMALAASQREDGTVIGMHPIGSLVEKGKAASTFPEIWEYRP